MKLVIISFVVSVNLYAGEFKGCGEYLVKGVFKKDETYIVNENSRSQMIFELGEEEKAILSPLIGKSSSFKGKITKNMDGTKGKIRDIKEVTIRFPNPLAPGDTGIIKLRDLKCD